MKPIKVIDNWIYSGDDCSYEYYYKNCPECGHQFYVYDRDNCEAVGNYCPYCGHKNIEIVKE